MKFVSYIYKEKAHYGVLNSDESRLLPMTSIMENLKKDCPENLLKFIEEYSDTLIEEITLVLEKLEDSSISLEDIKITSPIPYPRRNVICLGKNYEEHAKEVQGNGIDASVPDYPIYFTKIADPATGPNDDILVPWEVTKKIDYEVELALIIGKDGKNIKPEEAEDYIFGYTISNDVSSRDLQFNHLQWLKGKSVDSFTPIGPYIVHKAEIGFPVELDIKSYVNGEKRQDSNTRELIFDIPYILSDLSSVITLRAGDIILTGTPAGVGMGFQPHKLLKTGDVVECVIEKLGSLVNTVK